MHQCPPLVGGVGGAEPGGIEINGLDLISYITSREESEQRDAYRKVGHFVFLFACQSPERI